MWVPVAAPVLGRDSGVLLGLTLGLFLGLLSGVLTLDVLGLFISPVFFLFLRLACLEFHVIFLINIISTIFFSYIRYVCSVTSTSFCTLMFLIYFSLCRSARKGILKKLV